MSIPTTIESELQRVIDTVKSSEELHYVSIDPALLEDLIEPLNNCGYDVCKSFTPNPTQLVVTASLHRLIERVKREVSKSVSTVPFQLEIQHPLLYKINVVDFINHDQRVCKLDVEATTSTSIRLVPILLDNMAEYIRMQDEDLRTEVLQLMDMIYIELIQGMSSTGKQSFAIKREIHHEPTAQALFRALHADLDSVVMKRDGDTYTFLIQLKARKEKRNA
jgi:hypothetical protein